MRFLLDTHIWLWLQSDPEQLPPALVERLATADQVLLSAASTWEIGIKTALGKLELPEEPATYIPDRMSRSGTDPLAVEIPHTLAAAALPAHHRDPFDRLLVAQSRLLDIPLISKDRVLSAYDVEIIWT